MYVIRFSLIEELPESVVIFLNKFVVFICLPLLYAVAIYLAFKIGEKYKIIVQFTKYTLVGFSNLSIDFGILNILIYLSGKDQGLYYTVFKAFSFLITIINSYLWNKFWTFEDSSVSRAGRQFVLFLTVASIGMLINVTIASILVNYFRVESIPSTVWANISALVSIAAVVAWDFLGYKFFVFGRKTE